MDSHLNDHNEEISLYEIYSILKRHIIKITLVTVVFTVVTFFYSSVFITKQYSSSGTIIVNNRRDEGSVITNDEINSAKGLASVYSIIIKSDPIMNDVIKNLKLDMTTKDLQSLVSVSSVDATQVMRITAKNSNATLAADIVNEILKIAPEELVDKVEAGSVKVISEAVVTDKAISPNSKRNALLVGVLSASVMSGAYLLIELLDKRIKSQEDIEKYLGYPVLGIIPNVESVKGGLK